MGSRQRETNLRAGRAKGGSRPAAPGSRTWKPPAWGDTRNEPLHNVDLIAQSSRACGFRPRRRQRTLPRQLQADELLFAAEVEAAIGEHGAGPAGVAEA